MTMINLHMGIDDKLHTIKLESNLKRLETQKFFNFHAMWAR